MITIVLIDDHHLILEGLSNMLAQESSVDILATFTSAAEGLQFMSQNQVDIVITDLDMPQMNGISLIKSIRKKNPNQKIIVLSMIDQQSIINRMIKYDVNGYLMKNAAQAELIIAIQQVASGEIYYNKDIRTRIFKHNPKTTISNSTIPRLSAREKEILKLIIQENTTKEIAKLLFISEGTVITHRKHIITKLEVKNTAGMVRKAMEMGLV